MSDLKQRIATARKKCKYSQTKLGELIGVSRSAVGQWESGLSMPSTENLSRIAVVLNVSFEWLALGRGEAGYSNQNSTNTTVTNEQQDSAPLNAEFVSTELQNLIDLYYRFSPQQRTALVDCLLTLEQQ